MSEVREFSPDALSLLEQYFDVHTLDSDRSALLRAVKDTDVLWVRLRHSIDSEVMDLAPNLKLIVSPTTGLNHIDEAECARRGISILSLRGETGFLREIRATAELTVGLMLSVMRHIPDAVVQVRQGDWNRDRFKGYELAQKRVGIVGHGRLGRLVAEYLQAFGCDVVACDPNPVEPPDVPLVTLTELLETSDIVSLHINLTTENEGFFDDGCFDSIKRGAWLINTARGELVDEAALLVALRSGRIAGAALDVLANEDSGGMQEHPLVAYARSHNNLIITPHIGGATYESMAKTELFMTRKLIHVRSDIISV